MFKNVIRVAALFVTASLALAMGQHKAMAETVSENTGFFNIDEYESNETNETDSNDIRDRKSVV